MFPMIHGNKGAVGRLWVSGVMVAILVTIQSGAQEGISAEGDGKHVVGPEYKIAQALTDLGNPKGKRFEFSMRLADSKIFRGDDTTLEPERRPVREERKIFV